MSGMSLVGSLIRRVMIVAVAGVIVSACGREEPASLVASAKEYLAKNDSRAAIIQLKNALQANPDLAEARFLLGRALLNSGNLQDAEKELRRAYNLGYAPDEVVPKLAEVTLLLGEATKLEAEFGALQLRSPEARAALQTTLGEARLNLNKREAASAAFKSALSLNPNHAPAYLGQARLALMGGDLSGALALTEEAMAKLPASPAARHLKGTILLAQGKPDQALAAYRSALESSPDYLPARIAATSLLLNLGKLDEAKVELAALRKAAPKHLHTLHLTALLAYVEKNYETAREAIQQELQISPDFLPALALSGAIELELGAYRLAESSFRKVLNAAPGTTHVRRLLIIAYLRSGRQEEALDALKPIQDHIQDDSDLLALAGEVYFRNGRAAEAAKYLERAAALDPENGSKRTALALSHIVAGEKERGLRELESAVATDTTHNRAALAVIMASVRGGDMDRALKEIDALAKRQPNNPLSRTLEGKARIAKRDVAGARESYERALALNPAYLPAARDLAALDLADNKPDKAKKRIETIIAKDPKNAGAYLSLAELRMRSGAPADEVERLINNAVEAKPNWSVPRRVLVNFYMSVSKPHKAVEAAQNALAAIPDNPELLEGLGTALTATGDRQGALNTYQALARHQPNSPTPYLRMAGLQLAAKDEAAAERSLKKALAIQTNLPEAKSSLIAIYLRAGRQREALEVAKDEQKQRPEQSFGFVLEGDIRTSKQEWPQAIAAYRTAANWGDSHGAMKLHMALRASGNAEQANKLAGEWIAGHQKDQRFRLYLAELALGNKNYVDAYSHLQALLENGANNNYIVLNNAALVAAELKDPKAMTYAEKAYALAPNEPKVMDTYGMLLADHGDAKRGLDLMEKAVIAAPDQPSLRLNFAKALIKTGNKQRAKVELQRLRDLGDKLPQQAEVRELIKGL
jgi:putative PEP-CTERM system TPR-repeat lipoprotein